MYKQTPSPAQPLIHIKKITRPHLIIKFKKTQKPSNRKSLPLMVEYNVSYVYIGSTATTYALEYSYYRQFNATQFLSTPYFILTKEIGDAWLFQFNASAALATYKNYVTPD
jgi:hypothetical protein